MYYTVLIHVNAFSVDHWNLLYPPKYILSPRDVTLLKGSSHQLECLLNTLERVNHWERIGHSSLPPSANSSINTSLVFTSIGESDGGRYRCVYTPAFGDPLYSEAIIKVVGKYSSKRGGVKSIILL